MDGALSAVSNETESILSVPYEICLSAAFRAVSIAVMP